MVKKKFIFAMLVSVWIITGFLVASAQEAKPTDEKPVLSAVEGRPIVLDKAPVRMIQDPYPVFSGIAMDVERGELIMTDDNGASVLAYGSQFQPTDRIMEPRRKISGPKTHIDAPCTVSISPEYKEIYTVENETNDNMCVFPMEGKGELAPLRELTVDHGAWGIFLDRKNNELFITTQHVHKVSVYRRIAQGDEEQLRYIQGPNTGLADPHGIYVDNGNNEIFVTNHGHWRKTKPGEGYSIFWGKRAMNRQGSERGRSNPLSASTGKFLPASITVYSRTAAGDVVPLRTIQGPKTQLNWPLGVYLDPISGQIAVANSNDSILFFDRKASGDVAPVRVMGGPATGLRSPTAIFIDTKRNELWVTNWDNHAATVYPSMAEGNVAPLRTIRNAPKDAPVTGIGNPGAIAYDPKRKQILVPN